MKFLKKMLLVGLLPGYLICQAQNVQNKEDVPLDLGYRVLPMGDYNGSAYTISGKQLRNLPVTNLSAVLAGLVPGYFARQVRGGGLVNEQNSFWIRGQRSNSPDVLVLVDGQERDFAVLSSHEVESITVLKDAAATALYGMRAGSGPILVTTRKGAKGKPQVELTAQIIAQQPLKELKSLNAADYARQHNIARHNDNMDPLYSNYDIMNYAKNDPNSILYPNVDWADKYLKDIRWSQRYNLNIQGGTEKSTYFCKTQGNNGRDRWIYSILKNPNNFIDAYTAELTENLDKFMQDSTEYMVVFKTDYDGDYDKLVNEDVKKYNLKILIQNESGMILQKQN